MKNLILNIIIIISFDTFSQSNDFKRVVKHDSTTNLNENNNYTPKNAYYDKVKTQKKLVDVNQTNQPVAIDGLSGKSSVRKKKKVLKSNDKITNQDGN
jgi:hypothetical protein